MVVGHPWALRVILAALRRLEHLAPVRWRGRWYREWEAELVAWWQQERGAVDQGRQSRCLHKAARALALTWRARHAVRDLLALHLEALRERRRRGESADDKPEDNPLTGSEPMTDLLADLRYSFRSFVRQPGFTLVAALTIAVGIGANTTIFAFVNGILLQPLSFREPERLVAVWPENWYSLRLFELVQDSARSYESLAGYNQRALVVQEEDGAKMWWGPRVTTGFFDLLGIEALHGRTFATGEDEAGSDQVVVLSHRLWQSRFGGDPDIVGKQVRASDGSRSVVGVLPPSVNLLQPEAEIVFPQRIDRDDPTYQSAEMKLIGRLAEGIDLDQAQAELDSLITGWKEEFALPDEWGLDARVVPLREFLVGEVRPTLLLLFGAVGLTLLIATANVMNLLLARTLSRRREISMRFALGARASRVVRQLMTESTVLAVLGCLPGLLLSLLGVRAMIRLLPSETPRLAEVSVNQWVVLFGVALALLSGGVVGVVGALQSVRLDAGEAFGIGSRVEGGALRRRARGGLVMAELALAVTLLAGAGLLVKSLWRLNQVDPGFAAEQLVKFDLHPNEERMSSIEEARSYFRRVEQRLEALPGVTSVATIWKAPLAPDGGVTVAWPTATPPRSGDNLETVRYRPTSPDYFQVAGIPLLEGRGIEVTDRQQSEPIAVISKAAAERLFPGRSALGEKLTIEMPNETSSTIVGIVGDVRLLGPGEVSPSTVYRPYLQVGPVLDAFKAYGRAFVVRAEGAPSAVSPALRKTVLEHDPTALIDEHIPLADAIRASLHGRRVTLLLVGLFTLTAVLLGAIGIYGVMAYSVRARRQELGIRIALGASGSSVLRQVLGEGLRLSVLGAALGVLLALALSRFLEGLVFEVTTTDPWVLATAVTLAIAVASISTTVPALRAGRANPVEALAKE